MPLQLEEQEVWGERFRRAFMKARSAFPDGVITYEAVAERVSQLVPTTGTTVLRLGYATEPPSRPAQRQTAYLALVAMGFDPKDFGFTAEDRRLRGLTERQLRQMLDPGESSDGRG